MDVTESEMVTSVNAVQPLKAEEFISFSELPITTLFRFVHPQKIPLPISETESGKAMLVRLVQSLKALNQSSLLTFQ